MKVESRDSVSLKPAELDELGQLLSNAGLPLSDEELDHQVEQFPLVVLAVADDEIHGFLFGSLERVGGTPCILWGPAATRKGRTAGDVLKAMTAELYRRAAISFPDEDVLVAGRIAQPSGYTLLGRLADIVPRPDYQPNGEERAWGRRLAKRFGCEQGYDDRRFRVSTPKRSQAVVHTASMKATGGAKIVSLVGELDPAKGEAMIAFGWAAAEKLEAQEFRFEANGQG